MHRALRPERCGPRSSLRAGRGRLGLRYAADAPSLAGTVAAEAAEIAEAPNCDGPDECEDAAAAGLPAEAAEEAEARAASAACALRASLKVCPTGATLGADGLPCVTAGALIPAVVRPDVLVETLARWPAPMPAVSPVLRS